MLLPGRGRCWVCSRVCRSSLVRSPTRARRGRVEAGWSPWCRATCPDLTEHHRRATTRAVDIPGWTYPSWADVLERAAEYQPRTDERLVVDTTRQLAACVARSPGSSTARPPPAFRLKSESGAGGSTAGAEPAVPLVQPFARRRRHSPTVKTKIIVSVNFGADLPQPRRSSASAARPCTATCGTRPSPSEFDPAQEVGSSISALTSGAPFKIDSWHLLPLSWLHPRLGWLNWAHVGRTIPSSAAGWPPEILPTMTTLINGQPQLTLVVPGVAVWADVPIPDLAGDGDALVRPLAVATCDLDTWVNTGNYPLPMPYALGHEFVAEVQQVAPDVTSVRPGDIVAVPFQISCGACSRCRRGLTGDCTAVPPLSAYGLGGLGGDWGGAVTGVVRVPYADAMLVPLPAGVAPAVASLDNLADAWRTVGPYLPGLDDKRVLIIGGASVGLYATAIARALGAQVTYVGRGNAKAAQSRRRHRRTRHASRQIPLDRANHRSSRGPAAGHTGHGASRDMC